jgi:hypothetical protein
MSGRGIFDAMRIVKNDHPSCKMSLKRIFDYLKC